MKKTTNATRKPATRKPSRKTIYAKYGIDFKGGKILSPIGPVNELLKDGNSKTGPAVYTFSLLPGTHAFTLMIDGEPVTVFGTCVCDCSGCYAKTGFFTTPGVIQSMARNTYLVNNHLDFVTRAIMAQLEILGRGEIRIHAAGDFNTSDPASYAATWRTIAEQFPTFRFWTYTKIKKFENLFDGLKNANIVKSIIPHVGVNFGTCEYIMNAYYFLKSIGAKVYICHCGFDPNQHCERCGVCSAYDFVLFLEHSTDYKGEDDPLFPTLKEIVMNQ